MEKKKYDIKTWEVKIYFWGGVLVQTALLNRLERIFEACFPSMFVPDTEEEVTSLKHLLETNTLPIKTREALAESG